MFNTTLSMKSRSRLCMTAVLAAVPLAMSTSATAQDDIQGFYVNVGGAFLNADFEVDDFTVPTTDVAAGVVVPVTTFEIDDVSANVFLLNGRVGYRINKYFAVEVDGGFGLGSDDASQDVVVPVELAGLATADVDVTVEAEAEINNFVTGFGRLIWPATDNFDLFVRGGYGRVSFDAEGAATASVPGFGTASVDIPGESFSEDGFAYGVGAEYRFNGKHGIRGDFSAITGDTDALFFAASYSYHF